jgi:hypothetical protein
VNKKIIIIKKKKINKKKKIETNKKNHLLTFASKEICKKKIHRSNKCQTFCLSHNELFTSFILFKMLYLSIF